jgi:AcrR family transcriptional regulator
MTGQPNNRRRYDASGRRAAAAETRRRVVRTAHELFVERGYAGTTIAAVAARAGVSTPTVFSAFGSKAGLLKACIDVAIAGDDTPLAVADRPIAQWVNDTREPVELLGRYATMMGVLARRAGPIYDVMVRAADAEPELAGLLADFERQRLRAATLIAEAVAERGGLPDGTTLDEARDSVWILNAPELYVTLTRKRHWSPRRYEEWARDALVKLLVRPPTEGPVPRFGGRAGRS